VAGFVTLDRFDGIRIAILGRLLELLTDGIGGANRRNALILRQIRLGREFLDIRESGGDLVLLHILDDPLHRFACGRVGGLKGALQDCRQLIGWQRIVHAGVPEAAAGHEDRGGDYIFDRWTNHYDFMWLAWRRFFYCGGIRCGLSPV
jgi:hypothetical protein